MAVGVEGLRVRLRYLFEASSVDSSTANRISDAQPDDSKISSMMSTYYPKVEVIFFVP